MRTIYEIRLANARYLASKLETRRMFADKIDKEPTQVSRFMGKNPTKKIGDDVAEDIEKAFDLEIGELDVLFPELIDLYAIGDPIIPSIIQALPDATPRTKEVLNKTKTVLANRERDLSDDELKMISSILDALKQ